MAADPTLEYQITATLGEFGEFESVSGAVATAAFTEHYEAGAKTPKYLLGTHSYSDLVLERAYKPDRDAALFNWDNAFKQGLEVARPCVIKIQNNIRLVVNVFTHPNCKPVSIERPNGTAGSSNTAKVRVTLKVEGQI